MRVLLDTHVFLWLQAGPERLKPGVLETLRDPENEVLLSVASAWELGIKVALGKLRLPEPAARFVPRAVERSGIGVLRVELEHALAAGALPPLHADPFDRMLVAQALAEDLVLATRDPQLAAYGAAVLPA